MKRFHVHVAVAELDASIRFYQALFGAPPTVHKEAYAKWMLDEPALNFAISAGEGAAGVNHLGLQVDDDAALDDIAARITDAGLQGKSEKDAHCCYAHSNKYWTVDPAGVPWESFHTLASEELFGRSSMDAKTGSACCNTGGQANADQACRA